MNEDEKARDLYRRSANTKFEIDLAARCMKPCFRNFQTPVVSENESECMTNCIAKGLESLWSMNL
jgi:hypothetical protein